MDAPVLPPEPLDARRMDTVLMMTPPPENAPPAQWRCRDAAAWCVALACVALLALHTVYLREMLARTPPPPGPSTADMMTALEALQVKAGNTNQAVLILVQLMEGLLAQPEEEEAPP